MGHRVGMVVGLAHVVVVACLATGALCYVAAVVEHEVVSKAGFVSQEVANDVMRQNLGRFAAAMQTAHAASADIIVFPEDGLTGDPFTQWHQLDPYVQVLPLIGQNPCSMGDSSGVSVVFRNLSCLAQTYDMVTVVNLPTSLTSNITQRYNTQVAFDTDGTLLQYYFKTHLFAADELIFDAAPVDQPLKWFTALDDRRFGMFICFDIFFEHPAVDLVNQLGIRDFVYSTYFVNAGTLPFMSALEVQQSFSLNNNVTFLASNVGDGCTSSGSGIYHNGVALQTYYNPTTAPESRVLVAHIPDSDAHDVHSSVHAEDDDNDDDDVDNNDDDDNDDDGDEDVHVVAVNGVHVQRVAGVDASLTHEQAGQFCDEIPVTGPPMHMPGHSVHFWAINGSQAQRQVHVVAQDGDVTCAFSGSVSPDVDTFTLFTLTAFDGDLFEDRLMGIQLCAVQQCDCSYAAWNDTVGCDTQSACNNITLTAHTKWDAFTLKVNTGEQHTLHSAMANTDDGYAFGDWSAHWSWEHTQSTSVLNHVGASDPILSAVVSAKQPQSTL